ncbi:alpha/beta fold hydrolase [Mycobacterium sp. E802]|uniref:alpha/beta fold hydrolase n=1 Tax=Mycobacterium sp. E802 TaxID=1834152 RepID=UPI0012FADE3A|nr:alpha/beta fold hydrolase [Mycobacterium sp. E802]
MAKYLTDWTQIDGLRVASIGSCDTRRNVLVLMGLHACVDAFELARAAIFADAWNARVTVADTPGCGHGGAKLSRRDRVELRHGNFTSVARRMVGAVCDFEPRIRQRPITVLGYSLGTSIAAAAAADPGLLQVQHMVMIEPVATRTRNPLRLMRAVRAEDAFTSGYLMRNVNSCGAGLSDIPASRTDLALLGYALSRGGLGRDLLRADRIQSFTLQIVHGRDSLLCPAADIDRLATVYRRTGIEVRDITVPGRHALWHSWPDVAAIARETRKQWT